MYMAKFSCKRARSLMFEHGLQAWTELDKLAAKEGTKPYCF